ncbi:metal-dependent hydrolase [Pseudonocardia sp. GCM10023141]|uniref:metal-dependent hydrolase n=1 Tax=Pseudonocardia sp. GCM10023141 TaxID=3252653 RepID=UPI003610F4DD
MSAHDDADKVALHARDVAFDWSQLPVHWIPDEPFATHLLDVLHLLLPEGERWFVELFSEALPLIRDPELAEDVRGFIGQEAMHAESHQSVLDHLTTRGMDTGPYVDQVAWMFQKALGDRGLTGAAAHEWLVERVGVVAAIEHVTAFLGQWILESPGLDAAGADPTMLDLLRWHGAEEVEHRAVAHDLYMHLDGRYLRRIRSLITAGPMLVRLWIKGVAFLLSIDPREPGTPPVKPTWRAMLRASRRGLAPTGWATLKAMAAYVRPGYHPSQYGSTDLAVAYLAVSPAARAAEARGAA